MNTHDVHRVMALESEIQNAILIKYGREPDLTLWRNNAGQLREEWVTIAHLKRLAGMSASGELAECRKLIQSLITMPARYVRYGLCVGSSDIIGIVQSDHCEPMRSGFHPYGQFFAAEIKRPGKHPTKEQQMFIDLINQRGGVAGCVHSVEEFGALLEQARNR